MRSRSQIHRPFFVSFTAGFIFFQVILQLSYLSDAYRSEAVVHSSRLIWTLLISAVSTLAGVFMLLGANWARILFVVACFPAFAICVVSGKHNVMDLLYVLVAGILSLLLFMQGPNVFFTGKNRLFPMPERDPYARPPRRKRSEFY